MAKLFYIPLASVFLCLCTSFINLENFYGYQHLKEGKFSFEMNDPRCTDHECRIDPEVNMNVSGVIRYNGYPCEEYTVRTEDGYLLGIQRIPYSPKNMTRISRPIVFLQHGLLCSSASWVINLVNQSLAYILADAGFDVWLGNVRGNTYSSRHVSLSPDSDEFWAWSMDEMVKYDLPAMINFALRTANQSSLFYVGHSQGTFIGFSKFSEDQEFAKKIKMFFALAPVTSVGYTLSPLRLMKFSLDKDLYALFGRKSFLPSMQIIHFLAKTACRVSYVRSVCASVIFVFGGIDVTQFNMSRLPVILTHTPAGTSCQNMIHWLQLIRSYNYAMYDFDSASENVKHYGVPKPPEYNVTRMRTPVVLFTGGHDWLADPKDVSLLIPKLKNIVEVKFMPMYNHFDFIWGLNARYEVYDTIIKHMRQSLRHNN